MAKENKNTIIAIVAVAIVVIIAIIIGINVGSNNTGDGGSVEGGETEQTTVETTDYSTIDVSVEYGDYDGMYTLSKSIQNGEATGEIVMIDGVVSHPMTKYSIVEKGEDGNKIGTEFVIEGIEEDAYPEDGTRLVITGEVIEKEPLYYIIKTTPEYVNVLELVEEE